ncbi:MAG: hypothetical protein J6X44_07740, partial [Thermoguttaceae bacterium]|nr:hypothetical protein [Thermoguttaceae bacterium]
MDAKTTKRMIEQLSREDLIALVVKLSSRNEKAEGVLLEFCSQKLNSDKGELVCHKQVLHYWEDARKIINECNKYGETSYSNE